MKQVIINHPFTVARHISLYKYFSLTSLDLSRSANCITDYCGSLKHFVFIVHMGADPTAACENEVHCPSVLETKSNSETNCKPLSLNIQYALSRKENT